MQAAAFRIIITFSKTFLGFIQGIPYNAFLFLYQLLDTGFVYMELLIVALGYGTRNNQWCTGIIDQYGVHLIHHGIMVFTLHHFLRGMYHVVTEVVKAEFVIGAIRDIREIRFSAFFTVGLVFVNTIHRNTQPFEDCSVPFLVTTGQVIVHRYDMHPFTRKGIKVGG